MLRRNGRSRRCVQCINFLCNTRLDQADYTPVLEACAEWANPVLGGRGRAWTCQAHQSFQAPRARIGHKGRLM
jgi:hypothetical protein